MKISPVSSRLLLEIALLILPALAILLDASARNSDSALRHHMTPLSPRLIPLFEKSKTVCFGHFVIDVPLTATVVYGPASLDSSIAYYPGEASKLEQHLAATLVEVEKHRDYLREGTEVGGMDSLFGKVIDGSVNGQKLVFGSLDHFTYSIHSLIPVGDDLFIQHAKVSQDKDDEIKRLNMLAMNLHGRTAEEIPSEAGSCIDGGFVQWQPEFERIAIGIRLKEFPDVHYSVEVTKNQSHMPVLSDLEKRLKSAEKDGGSWYSRITFFRRGPRQLHGWKGLEALAFKPAQAKARESHEFHFISMGAPDDPLQPRLDIQLDTGASGHRMGAVKPSLSDEEAVALWDKLTNSIRVRPSASVKSSSAPPVRSPLACCSPSEPAPPIPKNCPPFIRTRV